MLSLVDVLVEIRSAAEQHIEDELGPYWRDFIDSEEAATGSIYELADTIREYERLLDEITRRKLDKELSSR